MPSDEAEFNRWYDREHLEERVAIAGFLEARRYVAHDGKPKYLSLYSTETFEVLDSPAYRTALAQPDRLVEGQYRPLQEHDPRGRAHHHQPRPVGRGAALGIIRLRRRWTRINCAPHCGISSIPASWTASSRCICSKAIPHCPDRSPTIPRPPIPAPATGSC